MRAYRLDHLDDSGGLVQSETGFAHDHYLLRIISGLSAPQLRYFLKRR